MECSWQKEVKAQNPKAEENKQSKDKKWVSQTKEKQKQNSDLVIKDEKQQQAFIDTHHFLG